MKIAVIGYSGSGKSTMARQLGALYGCPVLHLDAVQFTAGWRERPLAQAQAMVEAFMQNPGWVIDGNYAKFFRDQRLAQADQIVFFNFPRLVCLWQALRRYRRYRGRTREDMAEGCPEKMDAEFARWILWRGRTRRHRDAYRSVLRAYPDKTAVLRTRRQAEAFLRALRQQSRTPP